MSVNVGELRIANVPDTVQGSEVVEAAEELYKAKYAMKTCNYMRTAFPKEFETMFKSYDECVYQLSAGADIAFDKWKTAYPAGIAAWARASATRVR
ncbi:MAG: hypothetical protein ACO2PN_14660 [Pyrobaculum sp.]|jgi:hypothetical protein